MSKKPEINTVMSWLEGLAQEDWREFYSDSEVQSIAKAALELLEKQKKIKSPDEFKSLLLGMFDSIWDVEIDHPVFQDTVGELMEGVLQAYSEAVKWE